MPLLEEIVRQSSGLQRVRIFIRVRNVRNGTERKALYFDLSLLENLGLAVDELEVLVGRNDLDGAFPRELSESIQQGVARVGKSLIGGTSSETFEVKNNWNTWKSFESESDRSWLLRGTSNKLYWNFHFKKTKNTKDYVLE